MKAAFISRYGGPEVLEIGEQPRPDFGPHDLLVQVKAAGVNPVDYKVRNGAAKVMITRPFPLILGYDVSGVVVEAGASVTRFKTGDEIFACLDRSRFGTFAEFTAVRETDTAHKPSNLSHAEAASIPLAGLTSWQALRDTAALNPGEKVLIHAGSGGVGSFAIQLARHIGASIAATAGARNLDMVKQLGADVAIDYATQRFEDIVRDYDVVFDTLGNGVRNRSFGTLRRDGRLVSIAGIPTANLMREWGLPFWVEWFAALANFNSMRIARAKGVRFEYVSVQSNGVQLAAIANLLRSGAITPVIDKVFPLDQAREAIAHCEAGHATGKVVIEP